MKQPLATFSLGLLLLILSSSSMAQDEKRKEEWLEFLSEIVRLEDVSIMVDVDQRRTPPLPRFKERRGKETLERLATLINRGMRNIDGTYVFYRYIEEGDMRANSPHIHGLSWLQQLSKQERSQMLSPEGLAFGSTSSGDRGSLEYIIRKLGGGIGDIMLEQSGDSLKIGLYFLPAIEFVDPSTGRTQRLSISPGYPHLEESEPIASNNSEGNVVRSIEEVSRPVDGDLDFEDGKMVTLSDLFRLGRDEWGLRFLFDGRLAESVYFVSGKFDKERYMECIEQITRTVKTTESQNQADSVRGAPVDRLLTEYFEDRSEKVAGTEMTIGDFLGGGTATLFEILGPNASQAVISTLERRGLSMDHRVQMKAGMGLFFTAPGTTRTGDSPDGRPQYVGHTFGLSYRGS